MAAMRAFLLIIALLAAGTAGCVGDEVYESSADDEVECRPVDSADDNQDATSPLRCERTDASNGTGNNQGAAPR